MFRLYDYTRNLLYIHMYTLPGEWVVSRHLYYMLKYIDVWLHFQSTRNLYPRVPTALRTDHVWLLTFLAGMWLDGLCSHFGYWTLIKRSIHVKIELWWLKYQYSLYFILIIWIEFDFLSWNGENISREHSYLMVEGPSISCALYSDSCI